MANGTPHPQVAGIYPVPGSGSRISYSNSQRYPTDTSQSKLQHNPVIEASRQAPFMHRLYV